MQFTVANKPIRLHAQERSPGLAPSPAIVLLHGSGGSLDFWLSRFGPLLLGAGISLYAPHYFDRTGTVRADLATITDGVHVPQWMDTLDHTLRFVRGRPAVDPGRVALLGISLGAFLSLGYAALESGRPTPHRLRSVVEVSGGLVDPFRAQATPNFAPTLILHGEADTVVPVSHAHALSQKLTALSVAHRTEILPGEGHFFSPAALPRMLLALSGFLAEHLHPASTVTRPL